MGGLHPNWTRKLGFQAVVSGNLEAANLEDFTEAILSSSCVPPVLPGGTHEGARVLDGGLIDNVPAFLASEREGRTLVLLSKRYARELPSSEPIVYVQPSKPIRMDKFDYTNPLGLQEVYNLGLKDGVQFANSGSTIIS